MELTRQHYRDMIFCDFKVGLGQEECLQRLQLVYRTKHISEALPRVTVFRWLTEFRSG